MKECVDSFIIFTIFILWLIVPIWYYYEPKIKIIAVEDLRKHYKVYLWYNKWDTVDYKRRAFKLLFGI